MDEFDHLTMVNMDAVLEDVCRQMKHGGDHESRKFVAERLIECARDGRTTLTDLSAAAGLALRELISRKTA